MSVTTGPKILNGMSGAELGDGYLGSGNLTLRMLQALLQGNVINSTTNTPPSTPNDGDTYIVGGSPTGAWAGKTNQVAYWTTQNLSTPTWDFWQPVNGWKMYDQGAAATKRYNGAAWVTDSSGGGPTLQVNGVDNTDQTTLNLTDSQQINFSDFGSGVVKAGLIFTSSVGERLSSGSLTVNTSITFADTDSYMAIVQYEGASLTNSGQLSVEYVTASQFKIHSTNASDNNFVRFVYFSLVA